MGETTSYVAISPVATLVTATFTRYALFLSLLKPFMTNDTLPVPSVAVCSSEDGNFIHMAVPEARECCCRQQCFEQSSMGSIDRIQIKSIIQMHRAKNNTLNARSPSVLLTLPSAGTASAFCVMANPHADHKVNALPFFKAAGT